jgi:hypothetical protein
MVSLNHLQLKIEYRCWINILLLFESIRADFEYRGVSWIDEREVVDEFGMNLGGSVTIRKEYEMEDVFKVMNSVIKRLMASLADQEDVETVIKLICYIEESNFLKFLEELCTQLCSHELPECKQHKKDAFWNDYFICFWKMYRLLKISVTNSQARKRAIPLHILQNLFKLCLATVNILEYWENFNEQNTMSLVLSYLQFIFELDFSKHDNEFRLECSRYLSKLSDTLIKIKKVTKFTPEKESKFYLTEKAHILWKFAQLKFSESFTELGKYFGKIDFKDGLWCGNSIQEMVNWVEQDQMLTHSEDLRNQLLGTCLGMTKGLMFLKHLISQLVEGVDNKAKSIIREWLSYLDTNWTAIIQNTRHILDLICEFLIRTSLNATNWTTIEIIQIFNFHLDIMFSLSNLFSRQNTLPIDKSYKWVIPSFTSHMMNSTISWISVVLRTSMPPHTKPTIMHNIFQFFTSGHKIKSKLLKKGHKTNDFRSIIWAACLLSPAPIEVLQIGLSESAHQPGAVKSIFLSLW